jgi:O-antigen/teichoic acid export membrane protein
MAARVEISKRLLLINSASSVVTQLLQGMVLLWVQWHLLPRISAEEFSLYPLVLAAIGFIPLFTDILTAGLGRYVIDAYARGDEDRVRGIVCSMFPLLLAAGGVILFGGAVASWYVDKILVIPEGLIWDARIMMFLPLALMAAQLPCVPLGQGLYVRQQFVTLNVISLCSEVVKIIMLLILMLGVSTRVLWVIVCMVAAQTISLIVSTILSLREVPALKYRYRPIQWGLVRSITGFGGWNFLVSLASRLREYSIPVILNRLGSGASVELRTFQVGSMGRRLTDQWFWVLARPTWPIITGMFSMGAMDRFRSAYLRGGRIGLWITLVVAIPAMVYAEPVIDLYAHGTCPDAATVMVLMMSCYILSQGNWLLGTVASAKAEIRPLGIRLAAVQTVGVMLTIVLAVRLGLGAIGAALATLTVNSLSAVFLQLPLGLRLAEVKLDSWVRKTLVPGAAPACVGAVAWVLLDLLVKPDSWLELIWCTAIGVLCYMAVLLGFCLESQDKQDLAKVLSRIKVGLGRRQVCPP